MVSLYKRATPRQAQVMRMVEGACKNALDHHPEWKVSARFGQSIAKRVAGTLTSQWGTVLAASAVRNADKLSPRNLSAGCQGNGRNSDNYYYQTRLSTSDGRDGVQFTATNRTPFSRQQINKNTKIHRKIGNMLGQAKRDNNVERIETLVEVLRILALDMPSKRNIKNER